MPRCKRRGAAPERYLLAGEEARARLAAGSMPASASTTLEAPAAELAGEADDLARDGR